MNVWNVWTVYTVDYNGEIYHFTPIEAQGIRINCRDLLTKYFGNKVTLQRGVLVPGRDSYRLHQLNTFIKVAMAFDHVHSTL